MSRPVLSCPECGEIVEAKGPPWLMETADKGSRRVYSEKRVFQARCSTHGWFDDDEIPKQAGHHSTLWASRFKYEFPKRVQRELLPKLCDEEHHTFVEMLEGRLSADWDWLATLRRRIQNLAK